jgi:hypothetical protein
MASEFPNPADAAPPQMVKVPGGLVTLGPYDDDPASWGRREVWLAPYDIPKTATAGATDESCRKKNGRLASVIELEHALRAGLIQPAPGVEITSTVSIPEDAEQLAETEGVGFYQTRLSGMNRAQLRFPMEEADKLYGRCVPILSAPAENPVRKLTAKTVVRRGRGEQWAPAMAFFAIGSKAPAPRTLAKGSEVSVLHADGAWSLVAHSGGDDPWGWVPSASLGK